MTGLQELRHRTGSSGRPTPTRRLPVKSRRGRCPHRPGGTSPQKIRRAASPTLPAPPYGICEKCRGTGVLLVVQCGGRAEASAPTHIRVDAAMGGRLKKENAEGVLFFLFLSSGQHSLAPAGMESSSSSRCSFSSPFSLCTAEMSMPQEGMPIIFRTGRFRMATAVLPTRSSGS